MPKKPGSPSRLRHLQGASKSTVIGRIKPEYWDQVESAFDNAIPISASHAEQTNWLVIFEENHSHMFSGVGYHGGRDLTKLSSRQLHELANEQAGGGRNK